MTVTDGYDPFDDPTPQEIYDRGLINRRFIPSMIDGWHPGMGGGGGGGGGSYTGTRYSNNSSPLIPDLTKLVGQEFYVTLPKQTQEERQEMVWTNPEAADIAREILHEEKRESLRETITEAVSHYRMMFEGAHCGSVFSFMKLNDEGKHYWYAAIKNGDKWYTTAQSPRVINSDDEFITWLISLGAHESEAAELTTGASLTALALGPIETTLTESGEG